MLVSWSAHLLRRLMTVVLIKHVQPGVANETVEWSGRMHLKVLNCVVVVMCQTLDTPFQTVLHFVRLVVLIVDSFFLWLEISTSSIE